MRNAHSPFHGHTQILADSSELPRGGGFVLTEHVPDRCEREVLRVVAPEPQPIAGLERRNRRLEGVSDDGAAAGGGGDRRGGTHVV